MVGKLNGKIAMITGAASGIGAGIAGVFAREDAHVVIADLDGVAAESLASSMRESGRDATGIRLDVTARASIDAAVKEIESSVGGVDILVNNAGVSTVRDFLDIDDDAWDTMLDVNLKGVLLTTQRVLPGMMVRKSGRIVNISSFAGKTGLPRLAHYCASKFGVIGMTQALALEVAPFNITVNAVCPGMVRTPLWDDPGKGILNDLEGEKGWNSFVGAIPLGRPQSAEDMGLACLFLVSDAGSNITGEAISVSGGQ